MRGGRGLASGPGACGAADLAPAREGPDGPVRAKERAEHEQGPWVLSMSLSEVLAKTYVDAVKYAATHTLDPHSRAGAAIVTAEGKCIVMTHNKLARGVTNESWRWNRPQRYLYVEMAPRAAIYEAVRRGEKLDGSWIVTTVFPAADDARAIIETGFRGLASPAPDLTDTSESEYLVSAQRMLFEAAIKVEYLSLAAQ